jgi:hypothetical protein
MAVEAGDVISKREALAVGTGVLSRDTPSPVRT